DVDPGVVLLEARDGGGVVLQSGDREPVLGDRLQVAVGVVREGHGLVDDETVRPAPAALDAGELPIRIRVDDDGERHAARVDIAHAGDATVHVVSVHDVVEV